MLKKTLTMAPLLIIAVFLVSSCSQSGHTGKYADVKTVMDEVNSAFSTYISSIENVGSAADLARAMDTLSETITGLTPKMNELNKKYPELDGDDAEMPAELKEYEDRLDKTMERMSGELVASKMVKYMSSPEVRKSLEKLQKVMESIEK